MGDEPVEATTESETFPIMRQQNTESVAQRVSPPLTAREKVDTLTQGRFSAESISPIQQHTRETVSLPPFSHAISSHAPVEAGGEPAALPSLKTGSAISETATSTGQVLPVQARHEPSPIPSHIETHATIAPALRETYAIIPNATIANAPLPPPGAFNEQAPPLPALQIQYEEAIPPSQWVPNSPSLPSRAVHTRETQVIGYATPRIQAASLTPSLPVAPPSVPPTIQVTIGRIEVRAIPPTAVATPMTRQSDGPGVKSLDDYLRQRAKGGL